MKVTSATLKQIAAMPAEAMGVALMFLAEQLEASERTRALAADRKSRQRARDNSVTVTPKSPASHAEVTASRVLDNISNNPTIGLDIKSPLSPLPSKPKAEQPDGFEQFWSVYPKRAGNADKKPAAKAFSAAVKRATLETILWGARKYADDCKSRGKVGTEYVKQARTWLNADGWTEYEFSAVSSAAQQAAPVRVAILEASPQWEAWKRVKPAMVARDITLPDGRKGWGWYVPTEFPNQQSAA